jgi:hypothetical protein
LAEFTDCRRTACVSAVQTLSGHASRMSIACVEHVTHASDTPHCGDKEFKP